jgi:peptidoglycan/xylan/chitin deacetylase (PgdA/CDA1 family)
MLRVSFRRRTGAVVALGMLVPVAAACSSAHAASPVPGGTVTTVAPSTTVPPTTTAAPTTTTTAPAPTWPSGPVASVGPTAGLAPLVSRVKTTDPVVFLTIDDGMVRDPRVPQFLAEHNIPVTLFLNEGPVKADPAYFAQFAAMGAPIESHTRTHPNLTGMGLSAQKAQICGMADVIDQKIGPHGHLFRPPFGAYDDTTRRAAAQCGANAVITWRAALNDGMVQLQQGDRLQPGDIILSHFRPDLYDNLVELWNRTQEWGLSFAALEAYLPPPSG